MNGEMSGIDEFTSYFIGDKGYSLLPWLMTLYKRNRQGIILLETNFNKYLSRGRVVGENVFGILKLKFKDFVRKMIWI